MARRRGARTIVRYVKSKSRGRRPHKNDLKKYGKKLAFGAAAGLIVSIPLTLAAKYLNQPMLMEVGQRVGSIAASAGGGSVGVAGYQAIDAVFDRFVSFQGAGVSGTSSGMAYL